MDILLILCCISGWIASFAINALWFRECAKTSADWYDYCVELNGRWAKFCAEAIDKAESQGKGGE